MTVTYLTLVNKTLRQLNEVTLTSGTFISATGFHAQVQDAVNNSLQEIYTSEMEWPFLFTSGSQTLNVSQNIYGLSVPMRFVDWDSFFLQRYDDSTESTILLVNADAGSVTSGSSGVSDANIVSDLGLITSGTTVSGSAVLARKLLYIEYDDWQQLYRSQAENLYSSGYDIPKYVFRTQNNQFGVHPPPDKSYVVKYDHFQCPTDLSGAGETMSVPDPYTFVVVDGAMYYCYMFRENFESAAVAKKKFRRGVELMRAAYINRYHYLRAK